MNYVTASAADAYFALRLRTGPWDDATSDDQERALTMATKAIDQLNYVGSKADAEQTNQFPRGDDTEVPQQIKDACCEIALALLDGVDPEKEFENLFSTSNAYGGVRTTFDRTTVPQHFIAGIASAAAWRLLLPFLRDPMEVKVRRVD